MHETSEDGHLTGLRAGAARLPQPRVEAYDEGGGDGGDALAAAGEAEAVGGGGRDGDGGADGVGEGGGGLGAAGAEARAVADHLDRDVADREARGPHAGSGLGEQRDPGRASPRRVGRAELAAEVAEPGGGQQRVARGVRGDVAVGVTLEAVVLVGPGQAGELHRDARREAVDVDADPDAGQWRFGAVIGP